MTGHWEGDFWVDGDYRVARKWCDLYPQYYGPCAIDPDHGQGDIELDDTLAKALAKIDGYGGMGSTSGERHCFQAAILLAYNFIESSADIPPVPKFWIPEGHYWLSGITTGRLLKKKKGSDDFTIELAAQLATCVPWKKVAAAVIAALAAGGIVLPEAIKTILAVLGVG